MQLIQVKQKDKILENHSIELLEARIKLLESRIDFFNCEKNRQLIKK
jgi:hypothetical protein